MEFEQVIETQKTELAAVAGETEPVPVVLTDSDIPRMPRTNRLDKMTTAQARWALNHGDAWLVYLKSNDGEVYQSTGASETELSDVEKYQGICKVLDRVWLSLTGNMKRRDLDCTATGNSGHSLRQDCGIISIYLKGVSDGETKTKKLHSRV